MLSPKNIFTRTVATVGHASLPTPIGKPVDVQVQVSVDVFQIIIALGTITSIILSVINRNIYLKANLFRDFRETASKLMPKDVELDKSLEGLLTKILAVCDADRVFVAMFANRTNDYSFPFKYFSILWEVTDEATSSIKDDYQMAAMDKKGLMLEQHIADWDNFLYTKKSYAIPEESRKFFIKNGIETNLSRLIGDTDKGFVGILMINYSRDVHYPESAIPKLEDLYLSLEEKIDNSQRNKR